ncbi:MAG: nuclear transport factor 2 family protein [Pigmentiphaga sp.]|uniref:YybH family protein n=1 Tax=Pigmentiphaga sp. TaxID=1977564 RepID=UPI0029BC06DC|nr:nuclear transport factor 2 family protein [Pigmentiphaga sp.]MDX3906670.1 nuclear transport factor 2 family protein [Pigmentiphaga sp.]
MVLKSRGAPLFATSEEAEQAFYDALEQGDLAQLMAVWSDDEEIVCIHPGGQRLIGHEAVQESWREIFGNSPVPIRATRIHAVQSMMSSVHTLVEQLMVDTSQGRQVVNCYATNVYHKGPTGWRLVLHHSSQAPDDLGSTEPQDIPDLLH